MERESLQNHGIEIVRWIFAEREASDCEGILDELAQDAAQNREFAVFTRNWESETNREALCLRTLPGPIGRIIGWRLGAGPPTTELLQETVQHAKQNSFLRIEQLCSPNSKQAETLMSAGFQMITSLRQLCVKTKSEAQGEDATGTLKFVPANRLGLEGFAAIIRATMANSQDIEELAPLADYPDTDLIENFSNGASFRELKTWFALEFENKHVGCLLTQLHPNKALEIVYLGLRPDYRGRNFASNLLSQTQRLAAANDCELIVTAVDTQNIAAMRLYQKHGFSEYAGFDYLSLDLLT